MDSMVDDEDSDMANEQAQKYCEEMSMSSGESMK